MPSTSEEAPANVRVLVRVRPLSDTEKNGGPRGPGNSSSSSGILSLDNGGRSASMDFGSGDNNNGGGNGGGSATVSINDGTALSGYGSGYDSDSHRTGAGGANGGSKAFQFDAVLGPRSTQADVFGSVKGIVEAVAAGYNGTIVAYGQTGSGKTHTVFGTGGCEESESAGLVQRSLKALFRSIALSQAEGATGTGTSDDNSINDLLETSFEGDTTDMIRETTAKASFFEIFNERVYDLLSGSLDSALPVREDATKGVYVDGLQEVEVNDTEEAETILARGAANRQVASTSMNRTSSRSHAVFVLTVKSVFTNGEGLSRVRTSKFTLVDLAGSERQRSTNATGDRLKEASSINSSLLTLGNVINALVDREHGREHRHVPFRDSKLTFLLRDSWGGNSKTCLVATVSPSAASASETVSTLKFAQRAKQIKNTAVLNEDTCGTVAALRAEVARLRSQLDASEANCLSSSSSTSSFGRPPLPSSSSASGGGTGSSSSDDCMVVVVERRARRAEGKVSTLEAQLNQKQEVVKSLKRKLREEHMVQKFKQRRIDYLSNKASGSQVDTATSATSGGGDTSHQDEVAALVGEIESLRKQVDRPSPELVEMKVEYERVKEQLEVKSSEVGPSKFEDIERESLENLVNKLTDEKRALETKLADVSKSSSDTQKEIDLILQEVTRLEAEMEAQKITVKKREEEVWIATESGAAAQAKNDELQGELTRTKEELAQAKSEVGALGKSAAELKQTIERLTKDVEEKKTTIADIEAAHTKTQDELQTKVDALGKMLEESNMASDDKATAEMEVRQQLAAASKDNSILVQRVTDAAAELDKQKESLKESEARVEQMQQEKDAAVADAEQRLKDATASYEAKIESLETAKSQLSEQIQAKTALEEAATNEIGSLKASLGEIESRLDAVQKEKADVISDMQSKLEDQETTLNAKVQSIETEKQELEAQLASLKSASEEASSKALTAMKNERAAHQSTVSKLEEAIASLQNEKDAAIQDAQTQQQEMQNALEANMKSLEEEKSALVEQVKALEVAVQEASVRDATFQQERQSQDEMVTQMKTTIEQLEGKIQSLATEKDETVANAQKEMEYAKAAFGSNIQALEDEKAQLVGQIEALNADAQNAKDDAQRQVDEARESQDATIKEMQSKIASLGEEKNAAIKIRDELNITRSDLESKVQALEDERSQLQTAVTDADSASATAAAKLEQMRASASEMQSRIKTLEKEKEASIQGLRAEMDAAVEAKDTAIESIKDQTDAATKTIQALEEEKSKLSQKLADLQTTIDESQASADCKSRETSQELDSLRSKITELQNKLGEKETALEAQNEVATTLESKTTEIEELKSKLDTVEANYTEQSTVLEEMKTKIMSVEDESEKSQTNMETKLKSLEIEKQTLSEQALLWERAAEEAKKQVKGLKDQMKLVKRAKGSLEFELDSLREDQDTLNEQVRCLHDRNDELEEENERLTKLLEEKRAGGVVSGAVVATKNEATTSPNVGCSKGAVEQQECGPDADSTESTETTPFRDLSSRMDAVITRMSEVKAPAAAAAAATATADPAQDDDFEDDDSFDEDMFLPNATSTVVAADDNAAAAASTSTPTKPAVDKENAGTPFRAKSTGKKKRPLSALKDKMTTPSQVNSKKLKFQTDVKSAKTPGGVRKYPTVMSETKHRTGWSNNLKMKK